MNFLSMGVSVGQWFGITVRLHITFFFFAYVEASAIALFHGWLRALAFVLGLYLSILLHEFGHALAAKWCDGEADEILLWPLGGLAMVRPAWHPTAHLITTIAGPFVTLVLWLLFAGYAAILESAGPGTTDLWRFSVWFSTRMADLNLWLLCFNVFVPAFPMDGGRIVRDTLWHFISAEKATRIAVAISRMLALTAAVWAMHELGGLALLPPLPYVHPVSVLILSVFIFSQAAYESNAVVASEARGTYGFSIRERLARGRRQKAFFQSIEERKRGESSAGFHQCATCGRTERTAPHLEFRVCSDCAHGEEYCGEHLRTHRHS